MKCIKRFHIYEVVTVSRTHSGVFTDFRIRSSSDHQMVPKRQKYFQTFLFVCGTFQFLKKDLFYVSLVISVGGYQVMCYTTQITFCCCIE